MYPLLLIGTLLACNLNPYEDDYIARVDDTYLKIDDLKRIISTSSSIEEKNIIISQWVDQELLFQEALKRKLEENTTLKKQIKQTRRDLLIAALLDSEFGRDEINVKKAEVDRYYETNKDSYVRTEPEIHARHILVSSFRDATGLRAALREGADFSQLAHQHSEDLDTYYVGGDLGLFNESTEPILWMACMSLKLNTVSSPIQTDYGYHIIEVLAKYEEGSLQKINEIEEQITEAVVWQKHHSRVQKLIASLKKNSDWVIKDLP